MSKYSDQIYDILYKKYKGASTSLNFNNSFELLVATMLSAQCTDRIVNKVTAELFAKYENLLVLADIPVEAIEKDIHSCGFYRTKARNIKKSMRILKRRSQGRFPSTMEELTALPGVGRKTANIVMYHWFGKSEGVAVDTHVKRISKRLGLTENSSPQMIEQDLMRLFENEKWGKLTNIFIQHGRETCRSRNPLCNSCILMKLCPSAEEFADV